MWGTPSQVRGRVGGIPFPGPGRGWGGAPLLRSRGQRYQFQAGWGWGRGYPFLHPPPSAGWGTPPLSKTGWGTPIQDWMGYTPLPVVRRQSSSMPLAFMQEDFLVYLVFHSKMLKWSCCLKVKVFNNKVKWYSFH